MAVAEDPFPPGQGLLQKRDRLETRYVACQQFGEKFGTFVGRVRDWKGKTVPYTLGVVDVSLLLYAIDRLGVGDYVNFHNVVRVLSSLLAR